MNNALYDDNNYNLTKENEYLKSELERFKKNNTTLITELYGNTNKSSKEYKREPKDNIEHSDKQQHDIKFCPFKEMIPLTPTKKIQRNNESYKKKYFIIGLVVIFAMAFITSFIITMSGAEKLGLVSQVKPKPPTQQNSVNTNTTDNTTNNINTQIVELNQKITDLSDENIELEKTYDIKISELTKNNQKLYYPVHSSDTNSFAYVSKVLKDFKHLMPYKENVYDCSNMSSHLQWFLEANGIKAQIVIGKPSWAKTVHAWVFAYGNFGKIAIEAVTQEIIFNGGLHLFSKSDKSYYDYTNINVQYNSIFDIPDIEKSEYEWWNITKGDN